MEKVAFSIKKNPVFPFAHMPPNYSYFQEQKVSIPFTFTQLDPSSFQIPTFSQPQHPLLFPSKPIEIPFNFQYMPFSSFVAT